MERRHVSEKNLSFLFFRTREHSSVLRLRSFAAISLFSFNTRTRIIFPDVALYDPLGSEVHVSWSTREDRRDSRIEFRKAGPR